MRDFYAEAHELTRCLIARYHSQQDLLSALGYEGISSEDNDFDIYCHTYKAAEDFIYNHSHK